MSAAAVLLVLLSCVLHAGWNLLVKKARDKNAFTALYLAASCGLYLPLVLTFGGVRSIPPAGWACILASGSMYAGYFLALGQAYRHSDLSFAYPVARGLGPMLTVLAGTALLGERITIAGGVGIALILLAVGVLQSVVWTGSSRTGSKAALGWALVVAALYASYSIVDKVGVSRIRVHPVAYIYFAYAVSAAAVIPTVVLRTGLARIAIEWRRNWSAALQVGLLNIGAYVLVLYAMALPGAPVSYVVPLRTASVLFGVIGGVRVLGEEGAVRRIMAALMVMAGVTLIAWKG